jgi:CrcB protein
VTWLVIVVGASLGASARYALQRQVDSALMTSFPWGTMLVNLSGCLAFGIIAGLLAEHEIIGRYWRPLLFTGFLASYTTFSTFAFDSYTMIDNGAMGRLLLQVGLSVAGGIVAVWAGISLAKLTT